MRNFLYLFLAVIFLNSCAKHEEVIDTSFQVGSIFCSDGSVIHPSLFAGSGKTAIGVVFWCNNGSNTSISEKGYAVALEDLESDYLVRSAENIPNVSEDEKAFDGAANTASILNFADTIPCPAVLKTVRYSPHGVSGWFIPSVAQSKLISANVEKVYTSFKIVNGIGFDGWYWTSTEDGAGKDNPNMFGLIASLKEGRITNSNKLLEQKIRPIISIR